MDAKELRIGNLVNVGGCTIDTYQTYTPCVVNIGMLKQIQEENEDRPDAILSVWQPIPLTEEWLLKLGFEYDNESKTYSILTALELFDYLFEIKQYNGYFEPDFLRIQIEYVHQLQNLYFALTGQELEITKA